MKLSIIKLAAFIVLVNFLAVVAMVLVQKKSIPQTKSASTNLPVQSVSVTGQPESVTPVLSNDTSASPQQESEPTPDPRCIVTVRGSLFDVTQFRLIHEGGDIFLCGSDMTAEFNNEHDDRIFEKMQRYRLP